MPTEQMEVEALSGGDAGTGAGGSAQPQLQAGSGAPANDAQQNAAQPPTQNTAPSPKKSGKPRPAASSSPASARKRRDVRPPKAFSDEQAAAALAAKERKEIKQLARELDKKDKPASGNKGKKVTKEFYTEIEDTTIISWLVSKMSKDDLVSGRNMASSMHIWKAAESEGVCAPRSANSLRQRWCNMLRDKFIAEEVRNGWRPAEGDATEERLPAATARAIVARGTKTKSSARRANEAPPDTKAPPVNPPPAKKAKSGAGGSEVPTAALVAAARLAADTSPPAPELPPMSDARRSQVCEWVDTLCRATGVGRRGAVQALLEANADFVEAHALLTGGPAKV